MPLNNKYLKYSPEITLEIFTLIIDKLISDYGQSTRWIINYDEFKANWKYIVIKNEIRNSYNWFVDNNCQHTTETTIQEILGYDPFVKEFVLPEKWFIKSTKENCNVLHKWKIAKGYSDSPGGWYAVDHRGVGIQSEDANEIAEITFDQFKKYVLKEPIEEKEIIPEYVECFDSTSQNPVGIENGKIYKVLSKIQCNCKDNSDIYLLDCIGAKNKACWDCNKSLPNNAYRVSRFKPSTKEAFDIQNNSKSIEKWSVWSYIVALSNKLDSYSVASIKKGNIYEITCNGLEFYDDKNDWICASIQSDGNKFKWFATKSEAEEFAKTLIQPVKHGNGILGAVEPKQPLKQAVHCKTQEEWDFVTEKLGYKWELGSWDKYENESCINLEDIGFGTLGVAYKSAYTFQEWCDLNGYKMEKEVKFEVGKWYICLCNKNLYKCSGNSNTNFYHSEAINPTNKRISNIEPGLNKTNSTSALIEYFNSNKLASIEEIQKFLPDNHPDKLPLKTKEMILDESHIGKLVSLTYNGRFYDEVLATKEEGRIYLLNNVQHNNSGNSDKSVYKYSLLFTSIKDANDYCSNIKLLEKTNIIESDLRYLSIAELHGKGLVKRFFEEVVKVDFSELPSDSLCGYKNFSGRECPGLSCDNCFLKDKNRDKLKSLLEIKEQPVIKSKCNPHNIKKGDYIYVLKDKYIGDILEVTDFYEERDYNGIWIHHKNNSFSGGGFRADDKAYVYGKDYRLATTGEIDNFLNPKKAESVKSNQEFEAGNWIVCINGSRKSNKIVECTFCGIHNGNTKLMTPELDKAYPDKRGWGYVEDYRHATPEEINNHLISIGQIPKEQVLSTSEIAYNHLIDYGIKVHEEFFKGTKGDLKPKMILSIDDEELPMVSIIKTNSIKQLLNND